MKDDVNKSRPASVICVLLVVVTVACGLIESTSDVNIRDLIDRPVKLDSKVTTCNGSFTCYNIPMCWCHEHCLLYGNCCPGYARRSHSPTSKLASCIKAWDDIPRYMIDKCSNYTSCHSDGNNAFQSETTMPAVSQHSGIHYRNIACGLCNGESKSSLKECRLNALNCKRPMNSDDITKNKTTSKVCDIRLICDVAFIPYCLLQTNMTCNGKECQKQVEYIVTNNSEVYKNAKCAICDTSKSPNRTHTPCDRAKMLNGTTKLTNFIPPYQECNGYVFLNVCRKLVILPGYVKVNESCIPGHKYLLFIPACKRCKATYDNLTSLKTADVYLTSQIYSNQFYARAISTPHITSLYKLLLKLMNNLKEHTRFLTMIWTTGSRGSRSWFNLNFTYDTIYDLPFKNCVLQTSVLRNLKYSEDVVINLRKGMYVHEIIIHHKIENINTPIFQIAQKICPVRTECIQVKLPMKIALYIKKTYIDFPFTLNNIGYAYVSIGILKQINQSNIDHDLIETGENTLKRQKTHVLLLDSDNSVSRDAHVITGTVKIIKPTVKLGTTVSVLNMFHKFAFTNERPFQYIKHIQTEKPKGNKSEEIITIVGLSFSLLSLLATAVIYIHGGHIKKTPGKIIFSFCVCLFAAQFFFVFLDYPFEKFYMCKVLAIVDHFFWLSSFSWSSIMLLDLVRVIANAETPSLNRDIFNNYPFYSLLAWLTPTTITVTLICLDELDISQNVQYGVEGFCWIHYSYAQIFGFGVPIAVSIIVNIMFLARIFVAFYQLRINTRSLGTSATLSHRRSAIISLKLVSVMGLTWVFGFAGALTGYTTLMYMFSLINSFQGVYVFLGFAYDHSKVVVWFKSRCSDNIDDNIEAMTMHTNTNGSDIKNTDMENIHI